MRKLIQPDQETWLSKFHYSTPIRVRFCETDAFGHVNNVSYLIYFEQARVDYIKELELEDEFLTSRDYYIVTADIYCQYLGEVEFGEELEVRIRTSKLGNTSFDLEYAIIVKDTNNLVAAGRGAIVFMDSSTKKKTPIPDYIKEKIAKYENF